ncbi:MAG TPA: hypothetical protein VE732_06755 [Nitrososphaera sp.]|jgi:hypothetical protein|nr:hypothetical protein [Nitrososphaera sp.]
MGTKRSKEDWPFDDPPSVAVITTTHIIRAGKPILLVSHDEDDGSWQFLPGDEISEDDAMVVGLGEILEIDSSLASLANLPLGWSATRKTKDSVWRLLKNTE